MYFFRIFGIVNIGFKLTLLAMLEKDSEMILTKGLQLSIRVFSSKGGLIFYKNGT